MFKRLIFLAVAFLFLFSGVVSAENWARVDNLEMADTGNGKQEVYIDLDSIVKNADGTVTFLDRATVVGDKKHPGVYYWYARWMVKFTNPPQFRELEDYKEDPATKEIFYRTANAGGYMTETPGISPKEIEFVRQAANGVAVKDSGATAPAVGNSAESWTVDPATGCRIGWVSGTGTVITAAGWTGPIVNGLAEGQGTLTATLRTKDGKDVRVAIEGGMKAGKLDGKSVAKWSNGDSYSGDFKDGLMDGKGAYSWANGTKYDGEFKADYKSGYGIEKNANGDSYEGDFKNNKREGQGIYRFPDGRSHEGEWKNDVPNGQGVRKDAAGNIVAQGEFRDGQPVGQAQAGSQAAPAGATLTGFLGIPWGTPKNETEKAILSRTDTKRFNGDTFIGYFVGRQAELCLEYTDGKLARGYVWFPQASTNEAQDVFNDMKAQLSEKYGKPVLEQGAYVGAFVRWNVPGVRNETNYIGLHIVTSAFLVDLRTLPDALRKPFSTVIAYYDGPVFDREKAQKKQNNSKDL